MQTLRSEENSEARAARLERMRETLCSEETSEARAAIRVSQNIMCGAGLFFLLSMEVA